MRTKKEKKQSVRLRKKAVANGEESLYLDIYRDGKRHYEFLKLYVIAKPTNPVDRDSNNKTLQLAEAIKGKRQIELQNNEYGFENRFKLDTPFLEYFKKVMQQKVKDGLVPHTLVTWNNTLRHLQRYCTGKTTFRDITSDWLEDFKDYLNNATDTKERKQSKAKPRPLSDNSKVIYYAKVIACINQAYKDGILPTKPQEKVKGFKRPQTERVYLTLDEIRLMAKTECKEPVLKRAFMFSCLTGLRASDVQEITWGQITKNGNFARLTFKQKKTNGLEYLDINPQAVTYMGGKGKPTDKIFDGFVYRPYLIRVLKQWCKASGIDKDISFHTARHSFAVMMLTLNVPIYTLQKLLGHKEIQTTEIYAAIADKDKQKAVSMIPQINI
jgi:integrase